VTLYKLEDDKMANLTIMCGLPRCGKDSWIQENRKDAIVVSPDDIRKDIFGHQFHPPVEGYVWAFAEGMARMLLEQEKDVILNATNITTGRRAPWIGLAKDLSKISPCYLDIVWLDTSFEECMERNRNSKEGDIVPDEVMERMRDSFEPPTNDEFPGGVFRIIFPGDGDIGEKMAGGGIS
jgi:predicted kinase